MRRIILALMLVVFGAADVRAQTTAALLDTVQHSSFLYFWSEANPANGLIKDRSTSGSPASIAAVGFGLSSICVGIDHGWVSREAGRDRVLTTLQTFWTEPQGSGANGVIGYKGLFYHFLDMNTAVRTWDCELSTIDTALLFAGILDAKQYFTGSDPAEIADPRPGRFDLLPRRLGVHAQRPAGDPHGLEADHRLQHASACGRATTRP